jgi:hypothetical protein
MTGFIDCLAARARRDRSTVRPRPDVLLLAHLQPDRRPAAAPIAEDANPAGGPPPPQRVQATTAPAGTTARLIAADQPAGRPLPRRRVQATTAPAGTTARLIAADQPASPSDSPARTLYPHTDVNRSRSSSPPLDRHAEHARTTNQPAPTVTPRTVAEPQHTATAHAADTPAQADRKRQLTARPTSAPATHRGPTAAAPSPIPIIAPPKEPRARVDAEQAPTVEITIDRIDVRLENPPPPARSPHAGPRAPMTLERYLESREFPTNRRAQ